jgi:hypothetical protein
MPFDGTTFKGPETKEQTRAREAAQTLAYVIRQFESGEWPWVTGDCSPRWPHKGLCAGYAVRRVKNHLRIRNDAVYDFVARAIEREVTPDFYDTSFEVIIGYNDTHTFEEVLNVLRRALRFAWQETQPMEAYAS